MSEQNNSHTQLPGYHEILLLDDDEDDYILLKSLLHHAFGTAVKLDWYQKDGVAAEMICSGLYRLTLIDYRLGIENGIKVIQEAKSKCPEQMVFLFTAWNHEQAMAEAHKAGADGYLKKSDLSIDSVRMALMPFLSERK